MPGGAPTAPPGMRGSETRGPSHAIRRPGLRHDCGPGRAGNLSPVVGRALTYRTAVRAFKSFQAHHMSDRAAGLTYYTMLSLFPALLLAMALLGALRQDRTVTDIVNYLSRKGLDPALASAIRTALIAAGDAPG